MYFTSSHNGAMLKKKSDNVSVDGIYAAFIPFAKRKHSDNSDDSKYERKCTCNFHIMRADVKTVVIIMMRVRVRSLFVQQSRSIHTAQ